MQILLLAPHPFYQDRGTPIAVHLLLKVLSERQEAVDIVTYHEGKDMKYEHISIYRIPALPFIRHIRPGFSWKKILCDLAMFCVVISRLSKKQYQVVHAIEEAVFIALILKWWRKIPYIYDMDSSLAQQMIEQYPFLSPFSFLLNFFEKLAVRHAEAVVVVCDALKQIIEKHHPKQVVVLQDVSLLQEPSYPQQTLTLKTELGLNRLLIMYVGNLEAYQGIDLLLQSFARVCTHTEQVDLVIVGGTAADIQKYQQQCHQLSIHRRVHFLGPKPVEHLAQYLSEADILVSPRIKGQNTPMKLYSYLHSGKPIVATKLATHTQVLDDQVAVLVDPSPEAFAEGLLCLIQDAFLRKQIGMAGKKLLEEKYSYSAFQAKVHMVFDEIRKKTG